MILNELFKKQIRPIVLEGGNVSSASPGWQGAADQSAEEIDLKLHDRDFMVGKLRELLQAQNEAFAQVHGRPIWDPKLLASGRMFSGSSLHFFDVKGISTQDFLNKLKKTKVGDIDTQVDQNIGEEITAWLKSVINKKVGNGTFLGFNSSLSSIWLLDDPQVRVQVDYELGPYTTPKGKEAAEPTEWFRYSHSADYDDMAQGIKGVFHKYINRALTHAKSSTKYVARVLKKGVKISDEPVTDSDFSFAVAGSQGGGMSQKYVPYVDPENGKPMEKDGIPVMRLLDPKDRDYIQNLDQQFQLNFDRKRTATDQKLQNSFVGTIQLMNGSFKPDQNEAVARAFLDILFSPGAQMITANDPARDRDTKFAAIDWMIEHLKLPNAKGLRQEAVNMAIAYENAFKTKKGLAENFADGRHPEDKGDAKRHGINTKASVSSLRKTAKQGGRKGQLAHWLANMKAGRAKKHESLSEAEVKAQLRKGMPHLRDLKPYDFLDLVDELQDSGGRFKLENIPLNVKIDGFGGRFGKDSEGKPFMATSRTEPKYSAGFVKYHQEKGTTDPEVLQRAANFDKLFNEMIRAVKLVDQKLGPDFLMDRQVSCEVLFLPFATQTAEGKLKFVGIEYDQLPQGVDLVLVPYGIVEGSTGQPIEGGDEAAQKIADLGQNGSVMFMSNRLIQKQGLDVTEIINPLDNLEELKQIVSDTAGKRDRASLELRREVEAKLKPVQIALEKAIDEDPNIVGKDKLGQEYEGIVINSRLGPIKVTSERQKTLISQKNAAKAAARTEHGRDNVNKTAVVAIGSFVGHVGHEQLWNLTVDKAKELGGDPYLFIGTAQGKDDPIPPSVKVETWHKLYPNYAKNISTVQDGGTLLQKIKHELINPLPGKSPRYNNIVIAVGQDRESMAQQMASALMKAVNKFPGYENVKVTPYVTARAEEAGGTGVSFTQLRKALANTNLTPEQQLEVWSKGFDVKRLGADWIKHLMDITRKGMGIAEPHTSPSGVRTNMSPKDDDYAINYGPKGLAKPKQPVPERILNALIMPKEIISELDLKPQPKKSWADYGMPDKKPAQAKVYHGWQEFEHDTQEKKQQQQTPVLRRDMPTKEDDVEETSRMSAAVKLQRAFDRERAKSDASRRRGEEVMAQAKKDAEKKSKEQGVAEEGPKNALGKALYRDLSKEKKASPQQVQRNKERWEQRQKEREQGVAEGSYTTEKQILTRIRQIMYDRKLSGTESNAGELLRLKQQLKDLRSQQGVAEDLPVQSQPQETPQQQKVRAAITKGMEVQSQYGKDEYQSRSSPGYTHWWFDPKAGTSDRLSGIDSIDPDGTVVISLDDIHGTAGLVKKLAALGGMPGVKIRQLQHKWEKQGVAEGSGGAKYKVKSIGRDSKGDYYISPNTGKKVYKQAKVGDHETPNGEVKPKVETMLPASSFAGSKKNKLGTAGQWRNKGTKANKPARAGDLVGGAAESLVPVSEAIEGKMSSLIKLLENK